MRTKSAFGVLGTVWADEDSDMNNGFKIIDQLRVSNSRRQRAKGSNSHDSQCFEEACCDYGVYCNAESVGILQIAWIDLLPALKTEQVNYLCLILGKWISGFKNE